MADLTVEYGDVVEVVIDGSTTLSVTADYMDVRPDAVADEITGEDGQPMSPRAHLHIHAVVERQLAADEPKGVLAIAHKLEQLGVSRHDVRHEIGEIIAEHMWYMTKEGCPFDEGRYLAKLRKIVDSYR